MLEPRFSCKPRPQAVGNTQGDVGIFGGVGGRIGNSDLIKSNLVGAFAANGFIGNGGHAQVASRQGAEFQRTGADLAGFEHIGHEQGIVDHASQLDVVVGKHMLIVLGVLHHFLGGRAF